VVRLFVLGAALFLCPCWSDKGVTGVLQTTSVGLIIVVLM
jgi:hypothetical protein